MTLSSIRNKDLAVKMIEGDATTKRNNKSTPHPSLGQSLRYTVADGTVRHNTTANCKATSQEPSMEFSTAGDIRKNNEENLAEENKTNIKLKTARKLVSSKMEKKMLGTTTRLLPRQAANVNSNIKSRNVPPVGHPELGSTTRFSPRQASGCDYYKMGVYNCEVSGVQCEEKCSNSLLCLNMSSTPKHASTRRG